MAESRLSSGRFGKSRLSSGTFGKSRLSSGQNNTQTGLGLGGFDLNTAEGLRAFARSRNLPVRIKDKKKKNQSALKRVTQVLNAPIGAITGVLESQIGGEKSIPEAVKENIRDVSGFADLARDLGYEPQNARQKALLGIGGLAADILLDPTTYLTLGGSAAAKIGARALSTPGTIAKKVFGVELGQEFYEKAAKTLSDSGMAGTKAENVTKELIERAASSRGLSEGAVRHFTEIGVPREIIEEASTRGASLFDQGGIKFAGRSIASADYISKTPFGKIAEAVASAPLVQKLGGALGKTFVPGFGKNKKLQEITERIGAEGNIEVKKMYDELNDIFTGFTPAEREEFGEVLLRKKDELLNNAAIIGRSEAKKLMREELDKIPKLFDNQKMQDVFERMYIGENSFIERFRQLSGIPKQDAIAFYIPTISRKKGVKFDAASDLSIRKPSSLRKFKGLVAPEDEIKDAVELFTRAGSELVTARLKTKFLFKAFDEIGIPKGALPGNVAKDLGYKLKKFEDFFESSVTRGFKGKTTKEYWIPQELVGDLQDYVKPKKSAIDDLAEATGFDFVTRMFKSFVISIFPAFYIRNITSNQFLLMGKIGADVLDVNLHRVASDIALNKNRTGKFITRTGKELEYGKIRDEINKRTDMFSEGFAGKTELLMDRYEVPGGIEKMFDMTVEGRFNPLSREFAGRKILGDFPEQQAKFVAILSELKAGKTYKEAIKTAEDALFNYGKLTDFERSVMRRIIPFYTFARKNFEHQLKVLYSNPGRVAAQMKLIRGLGESIGEPIDESDYEGLPNFVLEGLGIKASGALKNKYGQDLFLTGFGLPIEEFLQRFSGPNSFIINAVNAEMGKLNPLFKFPLERATGQDFFRDRPIVEIDNAQELKPFISMLDSMDPKVSKEIKDLIQFRELKNQPVYVDGRIVGRSTKYTANPFALHLLRNLFTSRIQSTVGFIGNENETDINKLLRVFTGVRGWTIDQERQKFFNELEEKQELQRQLLRMTNDFRIFERPYIKKN